MAVAVLHAGTQVLVTGLQLGVEVFELQSSLTLHSTHLPSVVQTEAILVLVVSHPVIVADELHY